MAKQIDGWDREESLVMHELGRLGDAVEMLVAKIDRYELANLEGHAKLRVEIATLKVKASIWGAIGGAIVAIGIILTGYVSSNMKQKEAPRAERIEKVESGVGD